MASHVREGSHRSWISRTLILIVNKCSILSLQITTLNILYTHTEDQSPDILIFFIESCLLLGEIHNYALPNPQCNGLVLVPHIVQLPSHVTALQMRFDEINSDLSLAEGPNAARKSSSLYLSVKYFKYVWRASLLYS